MAEVFGTIGREEVVLNNAATETTLRLLLQSSLAANKQSVDNINKMAQKMGLDPVAVKAANLGLTATEKSSSVLRRGLDSLNSASDNLQKRFSYVDATLQKLTAGTAQASDLFEPLVKLGGFLGLFGTVLQRVTQYQEQNLKVYQEISNSGVNFSGGLNEMRLAASNAYLTLDQFSNLIKKNSETFAMMGENANLGAKAFVNLSNRLNADETGNKLRALGYTSEQINQSMVNYIATTGGRTKKEMENTSSLMKSTGEYLIELDKLSQFTGISRQKMEEEQKKAAAQAAFQRKMQTLNETERAKLQAAYDKAAASGIAGATDAVMSLALGMPPLTKEAQQFAGILPDAYRGLTNMTNTALDASTTLNDVTKASGDFVLGAVKGAQQLGKSGDALSLQGNQVVSGAIRLQNQLSVKGIETANDYSKALNNIAENQKVQGKSEADQAAKTQKAIFELGNTILERIIPALETLNGWINKLIISLTDSEGWFKKLTTAVEQSWNWLTKHKEALIGVTGALGALAAWLAMKKIQNALERGKDAAIEAAKRQQQRTLGAAHGTRLNPFYVVVMDEPGISLPEKPSKKKGGRKGPTGGRKGPAGGGKGPGGPRIPTPPGGTSVPLSAGNLLNLLARVFAVAGAGYTGYQVGTEVVNPLINKGVEALTGQQGETAGTAMYSVVSGKSDEEKIKAAEKAAAINLYQKKLQEGGGSITDAQARFFKSQGVDVDTSKIKSTTDTTISGGLAVGGDLKIEIQNLNKTMMEMLKYIKDTTENTRRTYYATEALNDNLFE